MAASDDPARAVPVRLPDVVTEAVDGETLLFHPALPDIHRLSPTATLIWSLCDGQRDVAAIVSLLESAYPDDAPALAGDVRKTLADLRASGVLGFA